MVLDTVFHHGKYRSLNNRHLSCRHPREHIQMANLEQPAMYMFYGPEDSSPVGFMSVKAPMHAKAQAQTHANLYLKWSWSNQCILLCSSSNGFNQCILPNGGVVVSEGGWASIGPDQAFIPWRHLPRNDFLLQPKRTFWSKYMMDLQWPEHRAC